MPSNRCDDPDCACRRGGEPITQESPIAIYAANVAAALKALEEAWDNCADMDAFRVLLADLFAARRAATAAGYVSVLLSKETIEKVQLTMLQKPEDMRPSEWGQSMTSAQSVVGALVRRDLTGAR